jgi:urease accessory protein
MIRAQNVIESLHAKAPASDVVVLDYIERYRRRIQLTTVRGYKFLLDLPQAIYVQSGDFLQLDDGRLIEVVAAAESLCEVKADTHHHLMTLAWHLGNRHIPTEIRSNALRIKTDHVIENMLRGLGARTRLIEAPFHPQSGAYSASPSHYHEHGHHHHD